MGFRDFFGKPRPIEFSKMVPKASANAEQQKPGTDLEADEHTRSEIAIEAKKEGGEQNEGQNTESEAVDVETAADSRFGRAMEKGKEVYTKLSGLFKKAWGAANVDKIKDQAIESFAREIGIKDRYRPRLDSRETTQTILGLDPSKRSMAGDLLVGGRIVNAIREYKQNVAAIKEAYQLQLQNQRTGRNVARGVAMAREGVDLPKDAVKAQEGARRAEENRITVEQRRKENKARRIESYFRLSEAEAERLNRQTAERRAENSSQAARAERQASYEQLFNTPEARAQEYFSAAQQEAEVLMDQDNAVQVNKARSINDNIVSRETRASGYQKMSQAEAGYLRRQAAKRKAEGSARKTQAEQQASYEGLFNTTEARAAEYQEAAERERQRIEESSAGKARRISREITQREAAQATEQQDRQTRLDRYQTAVDKERNRMFSSLERATSEAVALKLNSFAEYQKLYDKLSDVEGMENVPKGPHYFEVGKAPDPAEAGGKGNDNYEQRIAA